MSKQQILVGCDPEVFVKKNGIFQSAYGLIKGDKANPQPVERGAVQVDGMALEFNINPAATEAEFVLSVQTVFDTMCKMVPGYEVVAVPVADFDADYLKAQPKEALELGCDPDYNAWTSTVNPRPDGDRPMRTASGHVHVGWTNGEEIGNLDHQSRCNMLIQQLDFYLGLPSLMYDTDARRREMYGRAGACRYKSYGVEYRTLSNAWLTSKERMAWVFRATQEAVAQAMAGNLLVEKFGDIQDIINTSDVKGAKRIIKAAKLEVCGA
jgi:hypothetical protein